MAQVLIGLIVPFVYVKSLTTLTFTSMSIGQLGYWLVLPASCFLVLSFVALSRNDERFNSTQSGLWGAAIAGYLCMALPALLLFIASATYTGGGANIGLGILMFAMPVLLPIVMFFGFVVGEARNVRR